VRIVRIQAGAHAPFVIHVRFYYFLEFVDDGELNSRNQSRFDCPFRFNAFNISYTVQTV